jgi:hypothetical protein
LILHIGQDGLKKSQAARSRSSQESASPSFSPVLTRSLSLDLQAWAAFELDGNYAPMIRKGTIQQVLCGLFPFCVTSANQFSIDGEMFEQRAFDIRLEWIL